MGRGKSRPSWVCLQRRIPLVPLETRWYSNNCGAFLFLPWSELWLPHQIACRHPRPGLLVSQHRVQWSGILGKLIRMNPPEGTNVTWKGCSTMKCYQADHLPHLLLDGSSTPFSSWNMEIGFGGDAIDESHDGMTLAKESVIDLVAVDLMDHERGQESEWMVTFGDFWMRCGRCLVVFQSFVLKAQCDSACECGIRGADESVRRRHDRLESDRTDPMI